MIAARVGGVAALASALAFSRFAASASATTGVELASNCTIVGARDAGRILGFAVQAPDAAATSGGICTFATSSLSEDGIVSYSIVTDVDVVARQPYFRLLARRCGNVDVRAPNGAVCATYRKLANAKSVADYYADRTLQGDGSPKLGDAANATPTALYVLRGGEVFEAVVRRGELLDNERSAALARLLLERVPPIEAPASRAASKSP